MRFLEKEDSIVHLHQPRGAGHCWRENGFELFEARVWVCPKQECGICAQFPEARVWVCPGSCGLFLVCHPHPAFYVEILSMKYQVVV